MKVYRRTEIKVRFDDVKKLHNDNVGNEWSHKLIIEYDRNSITLSPGKSSSLIVGDSFNITTVSREADIHPDVGKHTERISLAEIQKGNQYSIENNFVVEDRRSAG